MNITKNGDKFTMEKAFEGILQALFEYEVKSSKSVFQYTGPKINPIMWHQLMTFFRWTYKETHSESQARFFINPKKNEWFAWAFPQEARTGMSSRELDSDDKKNQRAALPDASDLIPFGTIHHHCSASAFQSGTDTADEIGQDGLHITIGWMDKDVHDIHIRFYINRTLFTPDMSLFWDIGDDMRAMLPKDLWDRVAKHQMCKKVDAEFPDIWKKNLIEVKSVQTVYRGGLGYSGPYCGSGYDHNVNLNRTMSERSQDMAVDLVEWAIEHHPIDKIFEAVNFVYRDKIVDKLMHMIEKAFQHPMDEVDMQEVFRNILALCEGGQVRGSKFIKGESKKERKKRLKAEAKEEEEMAAEAMASEEGNGKTDTSFVFKPTHHIGDPKVSVMWMPSIQCYIRENGDAWDFEEKVWRLSKFSKTSFQAEEDRKKAIEESKKGKGNQTHWDADLNTWVDELGNPVDHMSRYTVD